MVEAENANEGWGRGVKAVEGYGGSKMQGRTWKHVIEAVDG